MKRLFIFFLFGYIPLLVFSQFINLRLTFSENDFNLILSDDGYDIYMPKHIVTFERDTLVPAIPLIAVSIPLDTDKEFRNFYTHISDTLLKEDIIINGVSPSLPVSNKYINNRNKPSYPNGIYPSAPVTYSGTHSINNRKYANFLVSPLRYDTYTKNIYLNKTIDIYISLKEPPASSHNESSHNEFIRQNTESKLGNNSYGDNNVIDDYDYKYIIITCDSLKSAFQKLAYWKRMKGVPTKVITTEEIDSLYLDGSLQIKIKRTLKDYYNGHRLSFQYALLGGDTEIVPAQFCHVAKSYYNSWGEHTYDVVNFTPVDWFYGCFDSMEWDTNNDGRIGELEDSIDIAAEIVVSRLPAKSLKDANSMVERIIQYEKQPTSESWENKLLMCGSLAIDSIIWNGENISDMHAHYEIAHEDYGFPSWDGNVIRLFDTGTDFVGGRDYDFTAEHLQTELSKGYTIACIDTHGAEVDEIIWDNYYYMEPTEVVNNQSGETDLIYGTYDCNDAESLVNTGNTILITSACNTNRFDDLRGDCIGETFMKNPQGGIIAYIGSSREGWYPASLCFNKKILQELLNGTYKGSLGKAFWKSKNDIVGYCNTNNYGYRWLLFSVNMLGDPEMPAFISEPCKLDSIEMKFRDEELFIMNNPYDSIAICVMSRDDGGATFYLNEASGDAGFADFDEERTICVTKKGYIPFIGSFAPRVYLQNENILQDFHVYCYNAVIGKNVTPDRDSGQYTVTKGKTTINSSRGVTISNCFEVKLGAEFEIIIENP